MNFSDQKEDVGGGFTPKDIYLGKASYKIVAVNPNKYLHNVHYLENL